jgi:hypothetical protein
MVDESLTWKRTKPHPFLSPSTGSLAEEAVTTPDVLDWQGQLYLYVGAITDGHERLLVSALPPDWLANPSRDAWVGEASVAIDTGPDRFDSLHVFDPAPTAQDDHVLLYYSAIGPDGDTLGMAFSYDGRTFMKHQCPVVEGRAPEVVFFEGQYYLFYVKPMPGRGYAVFASFSPDGETFSPLVDSPVFDVGTPGSWDSFEVTTPRIFRRNSIFYMLYAGQSDPAFKDIPHAFGLARSKDLKTWERYPANPVFRIGEPGSWDDGAIWFGTVYAWDNALYLIYEGGSVEAVSQPGPALTQVGLAYVNVETFDAHMSVWASAE